MIYESTRVAATNALEYLILNNDKVVIVFADSVKVYRAIELFKKYPKKCIDVGIAEQNAVAVAAGLSSSGLLPIVATYAGFLTMRACEQIRTFISYPNLPVILLGANGGIYAGEREGVTHQFIEDLGITRMFPNFYVISPADAFETYQSIIQSVSLNAPIYIRIGSGRDPKVYDNHCDFQIGKIIILKSWGFDSVIFATGGALLNRALVAGDILHSEGIDITIVDVHTIKPLDINSIVDLLKKCGNAVTLEDHTVLGGLGGAISEVSCTLYPVPILRLGLQDTFAESGEPESLLDAYKMSVQDICTAVKKTIELKNRRSQNE